MTNYKVINGVRYAVGVEAAPEGPLSKEFVESLKEPAKIKITTMIDVDIYEGLKRLAEEAGHGRYQTILNAILKNAVVQAENKVDKNYPALFEIVESLSAQIKSTNSSMKVLVPKVERALEENKFLKVEISKFWKKDKPKTPSRPPAKKSHR